MATRAAERARAGRAPGARALARLARAWGVQPTYVDQLGARRSARPEAVVAVLRALGAPIESPAGAARALAAWKSASERRACEPVAIAWDGAPPDVSVTARACRAPVRCELTLEGGETLRWDKRARAATGGRGRVEVVCRPPVRRLPPGAHRLRIEAGAESHETTILAAPSRCHPGTPGAPGAPGTRDLGLFMPVYALRSRRNWGVGDLTDLGDLAAWAGAQGCRMVGALPMLASYLDEPFDPSPYAPVSRLYWNELFLDLGASPDLALSRTARSLIDSAGFKAEAAALRRARIVDYRRTMRLKRAALDALAGDAFSRPARRREIEAFLRARPGVADYAAFRAETERARAAWRDWPEPRRSGRLPARARDEGARRTWMYAQFLLHKQLGALTRRAADAECSLYLDLPVGAHPAGYDTWRFRDLFLDGLSIGAPPDALFAGGQNWGLPPVGPEAGRRGGHAYFRASLRTLLERAAALRIDHVMGLHRLFLIPDGFEGADGVYVAYPAEEMYAALSIESHRARARIVGENLGTVPEAVNRALDRRGALRMFVLQFALKPDADSAVPEPPRGSLASFGTHDTPTFAAFWRGLDIDLRRRLGMIDDRGAKTEHAARRKLRAAVVRALRSAGEARSASPDDEEVLMALLRRLAASPADAVQVDLEDFWLETSPQNVPGITEGHANWRRKSATTMEELMSDDQLAGLVRALAALREQPRGDAGAGAPPRRAPASGRASARRAG